MAKKATVTLATLDQKLDYALEKLIKHDELFEGNGKPGMIKDVDRLIQVEEGRKWHLRTIWGTMIAALIGYIVKG